MEGVPVISAIHSFEDDAETVLQAMALSSETMHEICHRGLAQYHTATPYHPTNAPGTFMFHGLVHAMRELLIPAGWEAAEESLSFTFHSELSIALAVSSGNIHAGDPTHSPSFKYPKGPTTQAAIVGNASQLGLFDNAPGLEEFVKSPSSTPKRIEFDSFQVWWLLHHVDLRKEVLRAELSRPVQIGTGEETNRWISRIILEPIPFDDSPDANHASNTPDGPDFDVDVRKKA